MQGVGTAREGEVHPPVHQVLCGRRSRSLGQACPAPAPHGAGCGPGNSQDYLLSGSWHKYSLPPSAHQRQKPRVSGGSAAHTATPAAQAIWPGRMPLPLAGRLTAPAFGAVSLETSEGSPWACPLHTTECSSCMSRGQSRFGENPAPALGVPWLWGVLPPSSGRPPGQALMVSLTSEAQAGALRQDTHEPR